MKCERCKKNPAQIPVEQSIEGRRERHYLCQQCVGELMNAAANQATGEGNSQETPFGFTFNGNPATVGSVNTATAERQGKQSKEEVSTPRHIDDQEEQAFVAAVTEAGNLRDRAIIVLMLHTGLRARELCTLTHAQVRLGKRSGMLSVCGKRNKHERSL